MCGVENALPLLRLGSMVLSSGGDELIINMVLSVIVELVLVAFALQLGTPSNNEFMMVESEKNSAIQSSKPCHSESENESSSSQSEFVFDKMSTESVLVSVLLLSRRLFAAAAVYSKSSLIHDVVAFLFFVVFFCNVDDDDGDVISTSSGIFFRLDNTALVFFDTTNL